MMIKPMYKDVYCSLFIYLFIIKSLSEPFTHLLPFILGDANFDSINNFPKVERLLSGHWVSGNPIGVSYSPEKK